MSGGETGFSERFRRVADSYATREAAAAAAGVSQATLGRYIAGESMPGFDVAARLAVPRGFSLHWLWIGDEPGPAGAPAAEPAGPDSGALRAPAAHAQVDGDLLRNTIEALEELLADEGLELPPDKKARAIALIYELFRDAGAVDREVVLRIVRLAA